MTKETFQFVGRKEATNTPGGCEVCGGAMTARTSTVGAPYAYDMSGLPDVGLIGIRVLRCAKCAVESPIIPRIAELHRLIVNGLVHKDVLLTGREIRFLRKNAGLSAKNFASILGIDPSHLSRVETEKARLGKPTERLARAVAIVGCSPGEEVKKVLLDVAAKRAEQRRIRKSQRLFSLKGNHWSKAA